MQHFTPAIADALVGPDWLRAIRRDTAEQIQSTSLPSVEAEEWRYSPIAELDLDRFSPAEGSSGASAAVGQDNHGAVATIHTVNGLVSSIDLGSTDSNPGVHIGSLRDFDNGAELFGSVIDETPDYFSLLNSAFSPDPLVVSIGRGVVLDGPVVINHHVSGHDVASFPRLVVRLEENAQASVIERHTSDSGAHLVCPVVELDAAKAARLGYINVQALGDAAWQIGSLAARADRDATVSAAAAGMGGAYARLRSDARLVGRGAHGDLLAMYFGDRSQTLDFRTYQDHQAPDTTSNLLYKGAVGGKSRSIYTGLIRVRPDARGTNAFQTNRNLKLSDDAWAESVPNLEIENNDVKCSHASTVSPVDPDQAFYLESRGVPTETAERLIVAGFFEEVIGAMPSATVAAELRDAVAAKLARQEA